MQTTEGDSDEEWGGLSDNEVSEAPIDMEEEYIDEDRYTTVTVEAVSVDREGLHKPATAEDIEEKAAKHAARLEDEEAKKESEKKKEWPKKKKKTFHYETKDERRITERKQRAKRSKR